MELCNDGSPEAKVPAAKGRSGPHRRKTGIPKQPTVIEHLWWNWRSVTRPEVDCLGAGRGFGDGQHGDVGAVLVAQQLGAISGLP